MGAGPWPGMDALPVKAKNEQGVWVETGLTWTPWYVDLYEAPEGLTRYSTDRQLIDVLKGFEQGESVSVLVTSETEAKAGRGGSARMVVKHVVTAITSGRSIAEQTNGHHAEHEREVEEALRGELDAAQVA